jgi:DNA-binding CsgD family transcriptional regulator
MTTLDTRTREAYRLEVANVDPLMARAVTTGAVVQWDCSSIGGEERSSRFHQFLQDLELRSGLNMPLHASGSEWWGVVVASRVPRVINPDLVRQTFALSATVLLKRTLLRAAAAAPRIAHDPRLELLSAEQREILRWIAQGKSNADISVILGHSRRAVDYHVGQILRKLGVATRTQAAALLAT